MNIAANFPTITTVPIIPAMTTKSPMSLVVKSKENTDSLMRSVVKSASVVKSSVLEALPDNVLYYILEFLDKRSLYMNVQLVSHNLYTMLNIQSSLNRRLMVLNKSVDNRYGSNLMVDTYGHNEFNQLLCWVLNNHQPTLAFIDELLSVRSNDRILDSPFYIGGSIAVMIAHMLQGKEFNLNSYTDSDIDIYCIGEHNPKQIQRIILKAISNSFKDISHYVVLKRFIIDIVFEDPIARKIQIILHMKANLDEHMEFVDLPITQILLGGSVSNLKSVRHIYKTKLAQYAIDYKLNIVTDPIHEQTHNRIVKYIDRGFTTVVHAKGQLYCQSHLKSKIISIFDNEYNRYYVDMELREVFDVLEIISNPILYAEIYSYPLPVSSETILEDNRTNQVVSSKVFTGVVNTPLFRVLSHQLKLLKFISTKEIESVRQRNEKRYFRCYRRYHRHYSYYDSDDDDEEYEYIIEDYNCLSRVTETKFGLSTLARYRYRHNEDFDTFENLQRKSESILGNKMDNNTIDDLQHLPYNYPFYFPMNIQELPKLSGPLFFKTFNSYFLNKNFCALNSDGIYGDKKFISSSQEHIIKCRSLDIIIRRYTEDKIDEEYLDSVLENMKEKKEMNTMQYYKNRMSCKYSYEKRIKSNKRKNKKQKNKNNGLFGYKTKPSKF